jgi:xylulokinase
LQTSSQSDAAVTVGIDIGTTSVKAVAADSMGRVLARSRIPHAVTVPSPGRLEHDAGAAWCDGPRQALAAVAGQLTLPPVAVAVSAMAPTMTAVDGSGRPRVAGLLYGDERGHPEGTMDHRDPTGSEEASSFLAWAVGAAPDAAGFWPAQAVANRALGGPGTVDLGTAFSWGPLFGAAGWDPARCSSLGITPGQLPAVAFFGEAIGSIDREASGPALVAGGVDAFCEQLVAGPLEIGDVLVVCGSTLVVWVVAASSEASASEASSLAASGSESLADASSDGRAAGLWRLPDLTPGRCMVGGPSNAGGLFLDWVDRTLRPADGGALNPAAVPVWRPFLRGERVPRHDASLRGGVADLDLTQGPAALRRGAYEASAMALRDIVERAGGSPSRIVVSGGGSRVPAWLQAIADVTGVAVMPTAIPEGAALGAAWLARMGVGLETSTDAALRWAGSGQIVMPDPAWVGPCEARYQEYLRG